jgi:hypothetical protein
VLQKLIGLLRFLRKTELHFERRLTLLWSVYHCTTNFPRCEMVELSKENGSSEALAVLKILGFFAYFGTNAPLVLLGTRFWYNAKQIWASAGDL